MPIGNTSERRKRQSRSCWRAVLAHLCASKRHRRERRHAPACLELRDLPRDCFQLEGQACGHLLALVVVAFDHADGLAQVILILRGRIQAGGDRERSPEGDQG